MNKPLCTNATRRILSLPLSVELNGFQSLTPEENARLSA